MFKKINFTDSGNIYDINSRLRRRLGYLEPSVLNMYTYSSSYEKHIVKITLEGMVMYVCGILSVTIRIPEIKAITTIILLIAFFAFVCEIVTLICGGIKRLFGRLRRRS